MLNFDPDHYLSVENGAVGLARPLRDAIRALLEGGAENVFFAGSGGVALLGMPAARLLQSRSSFPTFVEMGAELVLEGNVNLTSNSIVIAPSVSGTTKEAVAALDYARARGAKVITLTGTSGTPLAENADINFQNDCADDTSSENFLLQTMLIALAIMDVRGEIADYDRIVAELETLPALLVDVKRQFEPRAAELADEMRDAQHHLVCSAGSSWYEAWYYAMCILEEMQWIWTRPIHASDFFHGTLELVEPGTSMILLKGEDANRALVERVEQFVPTITDGLRVIDSRDFALPGISADVRALISPIVFAAALERLSAHLEVVRDHPLTTRRYYRRIAY
ncbi:SIS domain-containing protein [Microbacterium aurantiacum]|uniref:SIS domain-containing protein n=1 Tax=Microbacterium aurantiacum TaxID=162393 RepID=A0AAJ2HIW8_9MICO|nr:SIS domain-containing protein [Microbacterium aurantiacum]MDS0244863.1 SIS domain-containing protein [Microbacterium aurantiacum]